MDSKIIIKIQATPSEALDHQSVEAAVDHTKVYTWTDGTGADQANLVFADDRTLAASANEELDLAGALTSYRGLTITFTVIRAIYVEAASGNTNNVAVFGAALNGFDTPVGAAGDYNVIRPDGCLLLVARDSTGYVVTAATGDLLRFENLAGGTSITYSLFLIGIGTEA